MRLSLQFLLSSMMAATQHSVFNTNNNVHYFANAAVVNVLSNRVVPICEDNCHCFGSGGDCPSFPAATETMIADFRSLTLENPMSVTCDPFMSTTTSSCVPALEEGEACVVELLSGDAAAAATCPSGQSYRLKTVPSLDEAIATNQYITHLGACGTCSSLQDLALMVEYPNLPYKAQQCFFRSSALKKMDAAIQCYEELGFTTQCSATLSYYQKKIIDRDCGYQCAAWAYDGDLGRPSCTDVSGCAACVDGFGISDRLELVSGRTFSNSGYPSQKARQCFEIAPVSILGGPDVCTEAPFENSATEVPQPKASPTGAPTRVMVFETEEPSNNVPDNVPDVDVDVDPPTRSPVVTIPPVVTVTTVQPVFIITATPTDPPTNPPTLPPTVRPTPPPTKKPTTVPTPLPTTKPLNVNVNVQQCLNAASIEVRMGALAGGDGVVCDCQQAETTGTTNKPRCFASASRSDDTVCVIGHEPCDTDADCCGNPVRKCRGGSCRITSGRAGSRTSLRLSGNRGGAARNRSAQTNTNNNSNSNNNAAGNTANINSSSSSNNNRRVRKRNRQRL
eukprot:jgi/Psemu1/23191/gm1.23191_g